MSKQNEEQTYKPLQSLFNPFDFVLPELAHHPVIQTILSTVQGILAILDHERRVIAVNLELLKEFHLEGHPEILGLRPGRILGCTLREPEKDCGTGRYCSSCGAAIALTVAEAEQRITERICILQTQSPSGQHQERCLKVTCRPFHLTFDGALHRYFLLFLQDITREELWIAFEQFFFHDFMNLLSGIINIGEVLTLRYPQDPWVQQFDTLSKHLVSEVNMHRLFLEKGAGDFQPFWGSYPLTEILHKLHDLYRIRCEREHKQLLIPSENLTMNLVTDEAILLRILTNLTTNAFDATQPGDSITLSIETKEDQFILFHIHNPGVIPESIRLRLGQRHFTTKTGRGHGFGLASARMFAREYLKGDITFSSSVEKGTTFSLIHPIRELTPNHSI